MLKMKFICLVVALGIASAIQKEQFVLWHDFDLYPCYYEHDCDDEHFQIKFVEDEWTCSDITIDFYEESKTIVYPNCIPAMHCDTDDFSEVADKYGRVHKFSYKVDCPNVKDQEQKEEKQEGGQTQTILILVIIVLIIIIVGCFLYQR